MHAAHALGALLRELEQRVRELNGKPSSAAADKPSRGATERTSSAVDPATRRIEDDLRRHLQTDVRIQLSGPSKGRVEIAFYDNDDLERILDLVLAAKRSDF